MYYLAMSFPERARPNFTEAADPAMFALIESERVRQETTLMMIPSENHPSMAVEHALSSKLGSKYSEGYPGRRYYQGQEVADQVESLAQERAKALFGVPHVNVQPYSGSPANFAVYDALLDPGDTIMGLSLDAGGHLTHGARASATSKYFNSESYGVTQDGYIDYEELEKLAYQERPQIIVAGTTAYPRVLDWKRFAEIADSVGAYLLADISHVAGLVAGGAYPSPVPFVDVVTTTTHKTLRGPRGAMIMVTEKGFSKDENMGKWIDKAVFPGLQGGPHMNTIAAIGVALHEASTEQFREYAHQVVANAVALARGLTSSGFDLVTGGTDSHLILVDLRNTRLLGNTVAEGLEKAGIVANRNAIPNDPNPPFYPSGLRLGTPAVTSRGMSEEETVQIAHFITRVVKNLQEAKETPVGTRLDDERDSATRRRIITEAGEIRYVRENVAFLCRIFPLKSSY